MLDFCLAVGLEKQHTILHWNGAVFPPERQVHAVGYSYDDGLGVPLAFQDSFHKHSEGLFLSVEAVDFIDDDYSMWLLFTGLFQVHLRNRDE